MRRAAKIEKPADLKGKRVGVPEYQQTAALWTRGALEHEFGVRARDMEWWMERVPSHSHRGAVGFEPPPGVTIKQVPAEKSLGSMMLAGEIDATVHYIRRTNLVDRSTADLAAHPEIRPLFADPVAEGFLQGKAPPPAGAPEGLPFAIHHTNLAESGIYQIQNANLGAMAQDKVWLSCTIILPLRAQGNSGSPVRPVAVGVPAQ